MRGRDLRGTCSVSLAGRAPRGAAIRAKEARAMERGMDMAMGVVRSGGVEMPVIRRVWDAVRPRDVVKGVNV
jgi:hypothetical protein